MLLVLKIILRSLAMFKTFKIALREYCETVKTKGFIIGIVLAPVLMSGSILAMVLLEDQVDITEKRIAIIDRTSLIVPALIEAVNLRNTNSITDPETGKQVKPAYVLEVVQPQPDDIEKQQLELSNRVRSKQLTAFIDIGKDVINPGEDRADIRITYHSENAIFTDIRDWMNGLINNKIRELRIAESQLDRDMVNKIFNWVPVENLGLVTVDKNTGVVHGATSSNLGEALGIPLILVMLMFLMIMMGAMPLLHSVLEEKTQRISEILLGSAKPFELMFGKLLGNLGVSFTASAVYLAGGVIVCYYKGMVEYIPFDLLPWFFVYMIAAIFMNGAVCIAVGAACNDVKETQSLMMPVMLPMMIPMFVLMPVLKEPNSSFATWLSLFPPCTPMLMLLRQSTPAGIPLWQPFAGLIGITVFTIIIVWLAGRIFRVGLLMQGKPPKLRDLARWAVSG